jgi:dihydrofolate reductase
MRKLVVLTFVSLDGVMQAPGAPDEDTSGGFKYGGWTVPFFDDAAGAVMDEQFSKPFELLLGKNTYDIFAAYWPDQKDADNKIARLFNRAKKYVVSDEPSTLGWAGSELITGDVVAQIKDLKKQDKPTLQVHGSAKLIQTLLQHDLVDELWLKIFPVTLGIGKRLFGTGVKAASWELTESHATPKGVIIANYKRAGAVKTGSFD